MSNPTTAEKRSGIKALKHRAKDVLWRVFVKLDGTLVDNARPSTIPMTEAPSVDSPHVTATERKTLVVNESWTVSNISSLTLMVHAVFESEHLNPTQQLVFDHLKAHPEVWHDHLRIISSAKDHLLVLLRNATGAEAADIAECLREISLHQEKTAQSKIAYSPQTVGNPDAVFWPDPTYAKKPRSLFSETPFARADPFVRRDTPVGSAGSCFAMEIAHRLQRNGFNYVITEPYTNTATGLSNSCARWGIIFNTPSFRQLVERAFDLRPAPSILWSRTADGVVKYMDPYREDVVFDSVDAYEADYPVHLAAAREAFLKAKVFIFTLGMNEVWRLKSDGSVFSRAPWGIASDLVEKKVLTVEENVQELETMLSILRRYNPDLKVIVSVSPVPLHATFRGSDNHVITANCHSKSLLRVVAEEFVTRNAGVYYLPSYEVVMYCTENAWEPDQRHVARHAVDKVMALFNRMFVIPETESGT